MGVRTMGDLQWPEQMEPEPPTNSERKATPTDFGVDTVGFTGPAPNGLLERLDREWLATTWDPTTGEAVRYTAGGNGFIPLGRTYPRVRLRMAEGTTSTVSIEFSVPRLVRGHNTFPFELGALDDVASIAADALGISTRGNWTGGLTLSRLDIARDFPTAINVPLALEGIARRGKVSRTKTYVEHRNPRTGVLESLERSNRGRWRMIAYAQRVKMLEDADRAPTAAGGTLLQWANLYPGGHLRLELQLRRSVLRDLGMLDPAVVTSQRAEEVFMRYAKRCHLDEEARGYEELIEWVQSEVDASRGRTASGLVAHLFGEFTGITDLQSEGTERKYRQMADQLGFAPADVVPSEAGLSYLDFRTGQQIVR